MLFGAFTNASQAMQSMDWAMGSISQNIANVNTTGYKEKDTEFKTVLSEAHAAPAQSNNSPTQATATSGLNIFGVRPVDRNMITKSGTITSSTVWSDLAINGRGFFMVTPPDSSGAPSTSSSSTNTLFTRAGNFQQKAVNGNNYFVTGSGQYLMGWQADAQGNIAGVHTTAGSPVSSSSTSTTSTTSTSGSTSLTPVFANLGQYITGFATSAMQMVANLPSNATQTASPQNFTDTSTVTDGFGTAQTLSMQWTRASGDTWTVDFSLPPNPGDGSVGTITGTPLTVTMDANGKITSPSTSASGVGYQDLTIDWSAGPTLQTTPSINLNANKPGFTTISETLTVYDNSFNAESVPVTLEHAGNGQWYMRMNVAAPPTAASIMTNAQNAVTAANPSTGAATAAAAAAAAGNAAAAGAATPTAAAAAAVAAWDSTFASAAATAGLSSADITACQAAVYKAATKSTGVVSAFSESGNGVTPSVSATVPSSVPITFDGSGKIKTPGNISFTVDWAALPGVTSPNKQPGTNTVSIDVSKLTQYSGATANKIDTKVTDQDGYAAGVMDGVDIAQTGEVIAHFNNGRTRTLFMIPVATFVSADQLNPVSGTLFQATEQAGAMTVAEIAKQGSGAAIQSSAVESSNVDLADQFTKMIVTQKAYSVNANVFKTADEMTQSVRDLIT